MPIDSKKFAIIRILEILKTQSSEQHPLTQTEISNILDDEYGIKLARKAIADNIQLLEEADYDIIRTNKGVYLGTNVFEKPEIRILIDSILCSRYLNKKHSKQLINKLVGFGGYGFNSHVKHIYSINEWEKTDNPSVLYNIDTIDDAIEKNKQILIRYGKYNTKNQLVSKYPQKVSPYLMLLHNQKYYLMGYNNYHKTMTFLRIDKMIRVEMLDDPLTPYKDVNDGKDIDYKDLSVSRPYMFADKSCDIKIRCDEKYYDQIVDWFGFESFIEKKDNNMIEVTIKSSPEAFVYWALQYGDICEVISPASVRSAIIEKIKEVNNNYNI